MWFTRFLRVNISTRACLAYVTLRIRWCDAQKRFTGKPLATVTFNYCDYCSCHRFASIIQFAKTIKPRERFDRQPNFEKEEGFGR